MITTTIRLYEPYDTKITRLGEKVSPTCQKAVEVLCDLYDVYYRLLKGRFNRTELVALLDLLNGHIFEPKMAVRTDYLLIEIEDGERYNHLSTLHGIDITALAEKVKALTPAETLFLQFEIARYWEMESSEDESLEKWLSYWAG